MRKLLIAALMGLILVGMSVAPDWATAAHEPTAVVLFAYLVGAALFVFLYTVWDLPEPPQEYLSQRD